MPKIILIGGGSASGKTYLLKAALKKLDLEDSAICQINIDDYYKDLSSIPEELRTQVNYDLPEAFDFDLLSKHLADLKNGLSIEKPSYDFTIHNRKKERTLTSSAKLIIVEGIMALVEPGVRELGDLKIFIDASPEVRLTRRLERDQKERGRTVESIIKQYFSMVLPAFELTIGPSKAYADILIKNNNNNLKGVQILASLIEQVNNEKI